MGISPWDIIKSALFVTPPVPTTSFKDKCVVVTGANRGIGLEACRWFMRLGARKVIMGVRDIPKGERAKESIVESEHCDPGAIELWPLDLTSYDSVKSFAGRLNDLERLDVLLCSAAITTYKFRVAEGHESQITVMVISTFLLALLALPKLKQTAADFDTQPHLSIGSSDIHQFTTLPERAHPSIFEALRDQSRSTMGQRYLVAKLIQVMVLRELFRPDTTADTAKATYPVIVNAVNPGVCHTDLQAELGWLPVIIKFFLARTAEVGSRTFVHAAAAGADSRGEYLSDCAVEASSDFVCSDEGLATQKRVWHELSEILEKIEPGVTGLI